ncbi:GNAT family N-acetyltransferase [Pseudomonas aeruginosa]|nr:acetyltransferase [Pseudomonas aeruginosa]EKU8511073.1 acetyltransferase [Pseudomonas aeruginosa]
MPAYYDFRDVTPRDLPLLRRWLEQPRWQEWWGEPETVLVEIGEAMESVDTEALIVELDGKPIAYLQSYDPHLEDDHPYQDQPFGTLGVDLSIGPAEMVGKGHGPALLAQFCDMLFEEGCPRVIIDPHPDNLSAIRAYEKAGFKAFDTRITKYGPALMMALDAPDGAEEPNDG